MTTTADLTPPLPRPRATRFWSHALVFAAAVLLANAVFGERGLMESVRARRAYAAAARELDAIRQANDRLRDEVRRLRSDPSAIEAVARRDLGLARPGEIVVTVRDLARSAP